MPYDPKVSVVIPVYNRAGIVRRAISSVLAQSCQDWELIVVDDGSDDGTDLAVKTFEDFRIRFLCHSRNRGQSAAQNTGIRAARGRYVAFLDSDDEWLPGKLAKDLETFERSSPSVGMVYAGKRLVDESGCVLKIRMPTHRGQVYQELLAWDFIGSCSRVAVRKSILDAVGGFDETMVNCQDWDLWLRVAKICEIAVVNECLINRHLASDQVTCSLRSICEGKARMIQKHREQMPSPVLGHHLGVLAVMLMNYDAHSARQLAMEALGFRLFQPKVLLSLGASFLGNRTYRFVFSKLARARHGLYVGRAAI